MKSPVGPFRAKLLCVVAVAAVLIATLWPLNPFPRNGVSWLQRKTGIRLEKEALVISKAPLQLQAGNDSESYAIELLVSPSSTERSSTILAFYNPTASRQLLIRQLKNGLGVAQDSQNERGRVINCDIGRIFQPGQPVLVAISSSRNGITFYVDGKRSFSFPESRISRTELSGYIIIGTSPLTYQPWNGEIYGVAIYANELTDERALQHFQAWIHPEDYHPDLDTALAYYTFSESGGTTIHNLVSSKPDLEIPSNFSVPHKAFLRSPWLEFRPHWHYALDVISNIAGFIPLGLILCAYFDWTKAPWKAMLLTIVICAMLSLTIEVLQYYLPRRGSGITDIFTNTLGGALGAALLHVASVRCQLRRMKLLRPDVN
jgi:VanZ family protein